MTYFVFFDALAKTKNAVNINVYSVLAYFGLPTCGEKGNPVELLLPLLSFFESIK